MIDIKGDIMVCHRRVAIGRALGETLYVRDPEGLDGPAGPESIRDFLSVVIGNFLLRYDPGHSESEIDAYEDFVIGQVAAVCHDNYMSKVLSGYDMILSSVLLTIHLADRLRDQKILIRFASDLNKWRYPVYANDLQRMTYDILIEGRQVVKEALPEEVRFIVDRYDDLVSSFPAGFDTQMLAPFAYWFLNKVTFDEFTAYGARGRLLLSMMAGLAWPAPM